MFPNGKATHLISDEDMGKLFRHLDHLEAEGLEHYVIPLAIRLQFEFAGRRGEIVTLQWDWVDSENRRVVWQIGRAHVCTPVTNAHLVCRLLLATNNSVITNMTQSNFLQ